MDSTIDLTRHGEREFILADGHDEASSTIAQHPANRESVRNRWATPSGETLREGKLYEIEKRIVLSTVRIDRRVSQMRFMIQDHVVSEALDACRIHPDRPAVAYGSMCSQCYDHYRDN